MKRNLVFTIAVLAVMSRSVLALQVLEPDFTVETYVAYESGVEKPHAMTFDDNGNLYIIQREAWNKYGAVWHISPEKEVSQFTSSFYRPRGIEWTGGTHYGDYLYVLIDQSMVKVDLDGTTSDFADMSGQPTAIAMDNIGNYGEYLYAATGGYDHTYRVDTDGGVTMFSDFPGYTEGGCPTDIAFDPGTGYGGLMYMATSFLDTPEISGVFTLDIYGNATRFAPEIVAGGHIGFDPYGLFDRDLFIIGRMSGQSSNVLWRVRADGIATEFAKTTISNIYDFIFRPDGAMYVAEYDDPNDTVVITRIRKIYVDDDGPGDPAPGVPGTGVGEPGFSDPCENGSIIHPFDSIQKAINDVGEGATIIVRDGTYTGVGNCDIDPNRLEVTIKSENGPNDCIINCRHSARAFIFQNGENSNTIIDGFKIVNGYSSERGGAIYCNGSSPVIRNCRITDSYAGNYGGAIGCYLASPAIENCIVKNNYADWSSGAIDLENNSNALVSYCTISYNFCRDSGGGMCSVGSFPIIKNCLITRNEGSYSGGASSIWTGNMTFINCTIADNFASSTKGAGGIHCWDADATVINTILWDNWGFDDSQIKRHWGSETITVAYSDVQILDSNGLIADSNWPGTGNINADPLFAAPMMDDYHLKSSAGRWTHILETNGDFNNDGIIDELDLAIFMLFWLQTNPADLNGDVTVDFLDYALFTTKWLNEGFDIDADFNGDGIVNRLDLDIFTRYWLQASLIQAAIADLNGDKMVDFIDYALFSANWRGPGNNVSGYTYIDSEISPCIDAGDPNSQYLPEPEPNGGRINMGAYGNTSQASKSKQ